MGLFDRIKEHASQEIPPAPDYIAAAKVGMEVASAELEIKAMLREPENTPPGVKLLRLARENREMEEQEKAVFLQKLMEVPNEHRAALAAGVTILQARKAKREDPGFATACEMAKNMAVGFAEEEAFRRAVEGVPKQVWHQGIPVGTEQVYSDSLMGRILEANDPRYERKSQVKADVAVNMNWFELVQALAENKGGGDSSE